MRFTRPAWPARRVPRQAGRGPDTNSIVKRRGWLPPSLRPPYLISVSIILLLMAIGLEVLRQSSNRRNGIVKYKRNTDISPAEWRASINAPTAFALAVMMLWEICAQDILRLEPYFCLANERGAPASVLFINYRFDAGFVRPIRAARNRHYVVFCVSLMSLFMRMALPSLMSGLFVTTPLMMPERRSVDTWPHLVDVDTQKTWYSTTAATGISYGLPDGNNSGALLSTSHAIAPMSIAADADLFALTLNQTVYWSSLACANVSLTGVVPSTVLNHNSTANSILSFHLPNITVPVADDSQCQVSIHLDTMVSTSDGRFQARHWEPMPFSSNLSSSSAFTTGNCSSLGLVGVILDAERRAGALVHSNLTTFVCEPLYQQAIANVSFAWGSTTPGVEIYPSTAKVLTGHEFSMQGFQRLMSSTPTAGANRSIADDTLTVNNMVSATNQTRVALVGSSSIAHLEEYQEGLGRLWNAEFITSISKFFNLAENASQIEQELVIIALALTVVPKAAIISETILILGASVLLFLAHRYHRIPNLLHEDPGSIAAQCAFVSRFISPHTLQAFSQPQFHSAKTRELRRWARGFWCGWEKGLKGRQLRICSRDGSPLQIGASPSLTLSGRRDPMPHFLTIPWAVIECVLLLCTIAAFSLSVRYMAFHKIESFASRGVIITVLFLIFGPTLILSIISSLFDSIHRQVSITDPWIRLRKGTLSATQLSSSNQTFISTLGAALRSPSSVTPTIASLSFTCFLNLVLILLCGGLFEPQQNTYFSATPELVAAYNSSRFATPRLHADFQGYDSALHAIATNASYAPWTTLRYSAFPLETNEPEDSVNVVYSASTRGIGTELHCSEISHDTLSFDHLHRTMNWTYTPLGVSKNMPCSVEMPLDGQDASEDQLSIQYAWPTSGSPFCQRQTLFIAASWTDSAAGAITAQNFTALQCQPRIVLQDFDVEFTPRGNIEQSKPVADSRLITSGPLFSNASEALGDFNQGLGQFVRRIQSQQQNHEPLPYQSSFPSRMTARVYTSQTSKTSPSNPPTTPPDPHTLTQAAQSLYQATFSTYLTLRRDYFLTPLPPDKAPSVDGTTTYTLWGLMPSRSSMALIIAIICIDVLALIAVFALYHGRYDAARIPTTLGSLMPWVSASHDMLRDLGETYGVHAEGRPVGLSGKDREFCLRPGSCVGGTGKRVWVLGYVGREMEGVELDIVTQSAPPDRTEGNIG
ncbi:hypothetical protein BJX66DRAFT_310082 [Aspergillus keveii]|uniref:Uncharacterized protein n=1 Tax=Aspergillus keveii TaxID=714993 RepID=A0ABR4FWW9_9EURO